MKKFLLLVSFLLLGFAASAALNVSGVCLSSGHRLSDEDILELAEQIAFRDYSSAERSRDSLVVLGPEHTNYANSEALISANPNCCRILEPGVEGWRDENEVGSWPRMQGRFRALVQTEVNAGNGRSLVKLLYVSNCGRISNEQP